MQIKATHDLPKSLSKGCIMAAVYDDGSLSPTAKQLDLLLDGLITKVIRQGDLSGQPSESLVLRGLENLPVDRLLLMGAGAKKGISEGKFLSLLRDAMAVVRGTKTVNLLNALTEVEVNQRDINWKCFHASQLGLISGYKYDDTSAVTKKVSASNTHNGRAGREQTLKKILVLAEKNSHKTVNVQIKAGLSVAHGSKMAMDLGNLPPNICTPTYLASRARDLGKRSDRLEVSIVDEKQMKKLGMHAFLSVSQGTRQPAKLIVMNYQGANSKKEKPIVFVGKGITFDTGGISIKPSPAMDEMKFDMCGAASVFGVAEAILHLKPRKNVICVVAAAENMPDGDASRPGDVVTSMSGQSIEILNTDAEGRLVLCDTLTYVERFEPLTVIDIATLTGACIVALGHVGSALMSNDESLAENLLQAGRNSGDKTWQLPLWDEYQQQLDSNFADMGNIGGAPAGSITAGCFLSRFADKYSWAHLDIAGVAWRSGKNKGATGRPVPLLMQYLLEQT